MKVKEDYILRGMQEYLKRFPKEFSPQIIETKNPIQKIFEPENGKMIVLLDERGKTFETKSFAEFIQRERDTGRKKIVFAIGPAEGWSEQQKKEAEKTLSLSSLTFPYQLSQLILVEQLYRAYSLIQGIPYHK